jgi:hypothetical protein
MADITIDFPRTKANLTITQADVLVPVDNTGTEITAFENPTATSFAVPVVIKKLSGDVQAGGGEITADSPGGTGSSKVFTNLSGSTTNVKVGDLVFGINDTTNQWGTPDVPTTDTGGDEDFTAGQGNAIATGAYVSAISPGVSITIAVAAGDVLVDQVANTAAELAFRRNGIKCTLYHMEVTHSVSGSTLTVGAKIHFHDGSNTADGADQDDWDDAATTDAVSSKSLSETTIDLDAYYTAALVARTDS